MVGTGASAIQFVPEIAPIVGSLLDFQRSAPNTLLPKSPLEERITSTHALLCSSARKKRREIYEEMVNNSDRRYSIEKTKHVHENFIKYLKTVVPNDELRSSNSRLSLRLQTRLRSDDWYPALSRVNVELIPHEVTKILPDGVAAGGREFKNIDVIIYNTGFQTTEYLSPVNLFGANAISLRKIWKDGPEAFLGMTVSGFPNFFMMYGPNTNLSGSIIFMLECQARYIGEAITTLDKTKNTTLEVLEKKLSFNANIQKRLNESTMSAENCLSYFQTKTGKIVTQWPGSTEDYAKATARLDTSDFVWK